MTDKDTSPRGLTLQEVALLELEAALEKHRREQGESDAQREGDARTRRRVWGLRKPGWRLPFNPWFLFDRRHPVMRRITVIAAGVFAVVATGGTTNAGAIDDLEAIADVCAERGKIGRAHV